MAVKDKPETKESEVEKGEENPTLSVIDAIHGPLALSHEWIDPRAVRTHPFFQFREGAGENGVVEGRHERAENYDVDKGGIWLCYTDDESGVREVVDGHHRRDWAINSKRFTSSKLHSGHDTETERKVPIRVMHSAHGWTRETAKEQGKLANEGGESTLTTIDEKEFAQGSAKAADSILSEEASSHLTHFATDSAPYKVLSTDAKGKTVTVRQRAMRAEHKNLNNRFYFTRHVNDAIAIARPRAKAGAMLMELTHPPTAQFCDRHGCEEMYADRPNEKCGAVMDSGNVEADGWVWITYRTLDTPPGRKVKAKVDAGDPIGLSTRFEWECHTENGMDVSDKIVIHTWDCVTDPAFPGTKTGSKIVSDSVLMSDSAKEKTREQVESEVGLVPGSTWSAEGKQAEWGLPYPFLGAPNENMINPRQSGEPEPTAEELTEDALDSSWID